VLFLLNYRQNYDRGDPKENAYYGCGGFCDAEEGIEDLLFCVRLAIIGRRVLFGISAVEPACLTAKERGGEQKQGDHNEDENAEAACGDVKFRYVLLPEKPEQIVGEMRDNSRPNGARGIQQRGQNNACEKISEQLFGVEMQKREPKHVHGE
jgi:hypothetical protein